ncbi:MAG: methylenetetrahydrofolate reductase [Woeseia sp.]
MLTFQTAVRDFDFTLSAELPLAPASTRHSVERDIDRLGDIVDAFQVTDSPTGVPHMSPLVAAGFCLQRGKDAVLHVSGRDRNRIALQSDILGAAAAGVTSLLLHRGDKLPEDLSPRARKVYEFGGKRLLRCAQVIGEELGLVGESGFFLGSRVSVIVAERERRPLSIEAKADLGCRFVQTQPVLHPDLLHNYMRRLVSSKVIHRVSVIVSVPLLSSVEHLDALMQRSRPVLISRELEGRFRASRAPCDEGITITAEVLEAVSRIPGVAGANLVSIEDREAAVEAIALFKARSPGRLEVGS